MKQRIFDAIFRASGMYERVKSLEEDVRLAEHNAGFWKDKANVLAEEVLRLNNENKDIAEKLGIQTDYCIKLEDKCSKLVAEKDSLQGRFGAAYKKVHKLERELEELKKCQDHA